MTNGKTPIAGAAIDLDGFVQYEAITNNQGYFEIQNVSPGKHNLNFESTKTNNSFSKRTAAIEVNGNLLINNLILPEPVQLLDPLVDQELTENTITLKWTKYVSEDYRE